VDEASFAHGVVLLLTSSDEQQQLPASSSSSFLALRPTQPLGLEVIRFSDSKFMMDTECGSSTTAGGDIGLLLISGSEALWGVVVQQQQQRQQAAGSRRFAVSHKQLGKASANIASRTRRGGSSAARYSRNRDGEELAFLRKVAESAGSDLGHCRHLLLGGSAQMRSKLAKELPPTFTIIEDTSVSMVDSSGLQHLASQAPSLAASIQSEQISQVVQHFLEITELEGNGIASSSTTEVCYGRAQTLAALEMGVVQTLLVAETLRGDDDWQALASKHTVPLVLVRQTTEACVKFCEGFEIGALLRYGVATDVLDLQEQEAEFEAVLAPKDNSDDIETASVSTATTAPSSASPSRSLATWLAEALQQVFSDTDAESLAAGAEVILACEDDEDESLFPASALENAGDFLRSENVPEEIIAELVGRAMGLIEAH